MHGTTTEPDAKIAAGTFVKVRFELLAARARSELVPPDTAQVPLVALVSGHLESAAFLTEEAVIITLTGRKVTGTVVDAAPQHSHGFGLPDPDIMTIASRVRDWIVSTEK